MTADRIILDNLVYREKTIHSFFIGPKLTTNIAYYIPVDFEFIFSAIKRPGGSGTVNQFEVNIAAEF